MRAVTVKPKTADTLEVTDVDDVDAGHALLLVDGIAVGVCGTDKEIARGDYGWAPEGHDRLVLGHESFGRVAQAPAGSDFAAGDLVVGVVRRPDPVPCSACARGEFDMCRNGKYRERGIKELDGYASERWTVEPDYAMKLDPRLSDVGMLMEPTTVVAKAWNRIEEVATASRFERESVLITGAGPIGLLAALLGVQRNLDVHVLDREAKGRKPAAVKALGATYHTDSIDAVMKKIEPDVVLEATGAPAVVFGAIAAIPPCGIVCLTGVSAPGKIDIDGGELNNRLVLGDGIVVGSVNANLDHYRLAAEALAKADLGWLDSLVTRRVPLDKVADAFTAQPDDIKVVVTLGS